MGLSKRAALTASGFGRVRLALVRGNAYKRQIQTINEAKRSAGEDLRSENATLQELLDGAQQTRFEKPGWYLYQRRHQSSPPFSSSVSTRELASKIVVLFLALREERKVRKCMHYMGESKCDYEG